MGQYRIKITKDTGEELKPEIFELQQHAVDWALAEHQRTGYNYFLEDLSEDPEWFYQNAIEKINKEEIQDAGITLKDKVEALILYFEDQPERLTEIMMKRLPIKEKYPLTKAKI